ncbi:MAG: STAS domain-containing protein [Patescibacteria group bacterium]
MYNTIKLTIDVATRVAPILGSRDILEVLKNQIVDSKANAVELDFSIVNFISRSAAHELLKVKDEVEHQNKQVSFVNTNLEVQNMIRTVAANRILPRERNIDFKPKLVDINSLFKETA